MKKSQKESSAKNSTKKQTQNKISQENLTRPIENAPFPQGNAKQVRQTTIGFQGSNFPPEYMLATLPHLDKDERQNFVKIIENDNERAFNFFSKKRDQNFILKIIGSILFVGVIIFCLVTKNNNFLFKLAEIIALLVGGSGITIFYFFSKNRIK